MNQTTLYRVTFYDDEMGCDCYSEYTDRSLAEEEAEGYEVEGYEVEVEEVAGYISTPIMQEKVKGRANPIMVNGLLTTLYVEEETDLDGVWWNDLLDVYAYSAPRGVIVLPRLKEWLISGDWYIKINKKALDNPMLFIF